MLKIRGGGKFITKRLISILFHNALEKSLSLFF